MRCTYPETVPFGVQQSTVEQLADEHRYGYLVKILTDRMQAVLRGELLQIRHTAFRTSRRHIVDDTQRMQQHCPVI